MGSRGVQTAMQAMRAQMAQQDVLGRNLANLRRPGFKQEAGGIDGFHVMVRRVDAGSYSRPALDHLSSVNLGPLSSDLELRRIWVDFGQGTLEQTDRALDVALDGSGFLAIRCGDEERYIRGGALRVDGTGRLVSPEGYAVLAEDGSEIVLDGGKAHISDDGTISVEGEPRHRLRVVEFDPGTLLAKEGDTTYAPRDPQGVPPRQATNTVVKSGFLESSNVDDVATMTGMVMALRIYQSSQRMLLAEDELTGRAVNEVGRV